MEFRLDKFFKQATAENLNFTKITLDVGNSELDRNRRFYVVKDFTNMRLLLNRTDGEEAGEISVSSMEYWIVRGLKRRLPRGLNKHQIYLEIL